MKIIEIFYMIFNLLSILLIITLLVAILHPKSIGNQINAYFICKYKETQSIYAFFISGWSFMIFSIDFPWIYTIQPILNENNSELGALYLTQIIEHYVKNVPTSIQNDMALCLTLLDKIIMESSIMIKVNIPEALNNFRDLLITYDIKTIPTHPHIQIEDVSEKQLVDFIKQCLINITQDSLWGNFADHINSQKHYYYFLYDLEDYIINRPRTYHNTLIMGYIAYIYDYYVQNKTYEITEIAIQDIPMEPEKRLHPDKPLAYMREGALQHIGGHVNDRTFYSYSPIVIFCVITGSIIAVALEIIDKYG